VIDRSKQFNKHAKRQDVPYIKDILI